MLCYLRHFVTLAHHGLHSFFFFFSFLKIFWFSSLFTARQKLDHKTEAKFESLSLGPFGGCRLPRLPSGESTLKCFSFAFLLI